MSTTHGDQPRRAAQSLLPLKYTPPPLRDGLLLRPDLQSLLAEARTQPATLIVAPAGYGKTTLLAQWVQELQRTGAAVGWLTLDRSERDPAMFLAYLIRACQAIAPRLGVEAWRMLSGVANLQRDWPLVAGSLCCDMQRMLPTAAFLVLDDLQQVIDSAAITQILSYLVRAAPPTLHLIVASRRAPTFAPLARLRTEGRLLELSQRELHLAADDARAILAAQQVVLSEAELELLLARTAGWALSIQLAARALANQPSEHQADFVQALAASQEQLLAYLASEVLAELPVELIEFVQQAALPERFDAGLLAEALGRDDVPYLLGRAQALGLPLMPLDEHGTQLRFHPLWRELLLRTPRPGPEQEAQDAQRAELHQRFGRALEARGDLEEALAHYASAHAQGELARALRQHAWPLLQSPRRHAVRHWLEQLSPSLRESDPELLYMWGYSQIAHDPQQALLAIEQASERYERSGQPERELRALADLTALLYLRGRPPNFIANCVRAVRAANRVRDPWSRGAALVCATAILYTKRRYLSALRVARQTTGLPLSPSWYWLQTMIVASINNRLGRPADALTAIDEALAQPQIDRDDRLRQNLLRQRAFALFLRGQANESVAVALEVHRYLSDYYREGSSGTSARQLALLLMLQGRTDEAATYLAQARAAFYELGALAPLSSLQAIEVYGMLRRGQAARAAAAAAAVLRRLEDSQEQAGGLRMRLLLAIVLGESGHGAQALKLTRTIVEHMQQRGYRLFLACAQLYAAHLAGRLGDTATHQPMLQAGWALFAADEQRYLPLLPASALFDVVQAAIRAGIAPTSTAIVIEHQLGEQALELLQGLASVPDAPVRARVATLLGTLDSAASYPALRALQKDRSALVRQAADQALAGLAYRPPYQLRIRTLGAFSVWRGDQEIRDREWRSSKARQLLQVLLSELGRTLPRDRLIEALWPDMQAEAAANNLRVTINRMSKALEPDRPDGAPVTYLVQRGETYGFNPASDHQIDAADFSAAVAEGQRALRSGQRGAALAAFHTAVGLYGGPYLPDNLYEDWTLVERERLAMLFNEAATRLGELLLDAGQAHDAIGLGWRVLEQDRAHEQAYRLLMRAHALLGERSAALRIYTRCRSMLQDELGVAPSPETTALYTTLRELG